MAKLGEAQVKRDGLLKQYHKDALTELNPVDTGEDAPILIRVEIGELS